MPTRCWLEYSPSGATIWARPSYVAWLAVGVLQAVRERGLRVRHDIGLVSIDDPP